MRAKPNVAKCRRQEGHFLPPCRDDPLGILDLLAHIRPMRKPISYETAADTIELDAGAAVMPDIPDFLLRKNWTPEMHARVDRKRKEYAQALAEEVAARECRLKEAKEAKKVKEAMDAQRAEERKVILAKREAKRVLRSATLAHIRRMLDQGPVTANEVRRNVAEDKKGLVPWALRTMLAAGEIRKASRQTYERKKP